MENMSSSRTSLGKFSFNLGFTLIELMITVAVVAILTAVAFPSYSAYIVRARIGDALTPLAQYQLQMEQASQDNGNYGSGTCAIPAPLNTAHFQFNCVLGANGLTFVASATGLGAMVGYAFTVNELAAQITTAYPNRNSLPAACWLTRSGDC